jgi:3-oxoacyl-(acyl-carrier-protein) synthase
MFKSKRVAVTGLGPLCSIGQGKDEVLKSLVDVKTNVELEKGYIGNQCIGNFYKHKIKDFDINNFGIDEQRLNEINEWKEGKEIKDLYFLLASIKLALDDSKVDCKDGKDIGLVVTHENPGLEQFMSEVIDNSFEIAYAKKNMDKIDFFKKIYEICDRSAYDLQTFMFLYHAAKTFDLHGFSLYVNNACASGLFAIETAVQTIKSGKNKIVVVAGSDYPGIYKHIWLSDIGLCTNDGKIKPFAKNRDGFIFGDGGAALVLEDYDHAVDRKAPIYSEYLGGGFTLESWKVTLPAVGENFYRETIYKSLKESQVKPEDIDVINAHGAGTGVSDQYEANTLTDIFGINFEKPFITTLKPYVGHNLGSCALLETVMQLIALEKDFIPPVLNCNEVDPKLNINVVKKGIYSKNIKTILKIACGFGGYDGAVVFRRVGAKYETS